MVSRVFGFARDILIAAVLGTGRRGRRLLRRLPLPQPVPPAVRRGRLQLGVRAAVRQEARGRGQGGRARLRARGDGRPGVRDPGADGDRRDRHAVPDVRPGSRLQRDPGEVRPRRAADPHHHALPAVHVAGGAAVGRAELGRQVRRELRRLHRPQPHDDGGHARRPCHGTEERSARRHHPGLGRVRRGPAAAVAARRRRPPQRPLAQAQVAAHERGHAPPDPARHPRRHRRRRHADQHRHRHHRRLAAARRRLASLLCRPRLRAAAGHRRHRHRRGAAARRVAPPARRQPRRRHGQPEPLPRVRHAAHRAGRGGAGRGAGRDRQGPVRARRLHRRRYAGHGLCARHLRPRPAVVRADQGVPARLLRARGHGNADALRRRRPHRQHAGLDRAVLPVPPRWA